VKPVVILLLLQLPLLVAWALFVGYRSTEKQAGRAIMWFALSMVCSAAYLLLVRFTSHTHWHPAIFLPLNLAFLPLYAFVFYWRSIAVELVHHHWTKVLFWFLLLELSTTLLPLGAWGYTANFDSSMVAFAFNIKKSVLVIFGLVSPIVWMLLYRGLQRFKQKDENSTLSKMLNTQLWLSLSLVPLGLLPPVATVFGYSGYTFYEVQGGLSGFVVAFMLVNHHRCIDPLLRALQNEKEQSGPHNQHFQAFVAYVNRPEILFQPALRLNEVAASLDLSPNYLSSIINAQVPGGFVEYINGCRVNALLDKFRAGEHQSKRISALAEEVGFGSKSNFQAVFRKTTGLTPSAWLEAHSL
jgi:AraC-like DNA-binding protein